MLKRVLFSCAVLIGTVYLACGGDSGTTLKQKPQIVTDRDSIVDTLFAGQGRPQTVIITNQGVEDLVVSSLQLSASDPGLVTGTGAPFQLLADGVLDPNATGTPVIKNTIKSNQSGLVSLQFTRPSPGIYQQADGGIYQASLTISSNAENVPSKVLPLEIFPPALADGGHGP